MAEEHPIKFDLERFSVGEVDEAAKTAIGAHIEGCDGCRDHLAELAREKESLAKELPPRIFAEKVAARAAESKGGLFEVLARLFQVPRVRWTIPIGAVVLAGLALF